MQLEILKRERAIGLAMVLASLGFVISLNVLNVDAFIVKQNVQRELRGNVEKHLTQGGRVELDAQYFLDLSDDAVPALAEAFQNASLPETVREKVGAALFCMHNQRSDESLPWQGFHVSRYRADQIFTALKTDLNAYHIVDENWPVTIATPSGEEFSCYQYFYD